MNSNKLFTVSKSSKLYKFYQFIYEHNPLCAMVTPQHYKRETQIFTDICTFLRTNLFYLIFSLPATLFTLFLLISGFALIEYIAISPIIYYFDPNFNDNILMHAQTALLIYGGMLGTYILYKLKYYFNNKSITQDKQPNIYIQAIKDKHNKICRQIELKD